MARRTKEEVEKEIAALRALKPIGGFKEKTRDSLAVAIDALSGEIDTTSDEFEELDDEVKDIAQSAIAWKDGHSEEKPSSGWDGLAE